MTELKGQAAYARVRVGEEKCAQNKQNLPYYAWYIMKTAICCRTESRRIGRDTPFQAGISNRERV